MRIRLRMLTIGRKQAMLLPSAQSSLSVSALFLLQVQHTLTQYNTFSSSGTKYNTFSCSKSSIRTYTIQYIFLLQVQHTRTQYNTFSCNNCTVYTLYMYNMYNIFFSFIRTHIQKTNTLCTLNIYTYVYVYIHIYTNDNIHVCLQNISLPFLASSLTCIHMQYNRHQGLFTYYVSCERGGEK